MKKIRPSMTRAKKRTPPRWLMGVPSAALVGGARKLEADGPLFRAFSDQHESGLFQDADGRGEVGKSLRGHARHLRVPEGPGEERLDRLRPEPDFLVFLEDRVSDLDHPVRRGVPFEAAVADRDASPRAVRHSSRRPEGYPSS